MADFAENEANFRGVGINWRFPQIRVQGGENGFLMLHKHVTQPAESRAAELQ